jgi:hypothetical protein
VHGVVGGGYPEAESGLSKIALKWILDEAIANGLAVESQKMAAILGDRGGAHVKPEPTAKAHESLHGLWLAAEVLFKRHWDNKDKQWALAHESRAPPDLPAGSLVHSSAFPQVRRRIAKAPAERCGDRGLNLADVDQAPPLHALNILERDRRLRRHGTLRLGGRRACVRAYHHRSGGMAAANLEAGSQFAFP